MPEGQRHPEDAMRSPAIIHQTVLVERLRDAVVAVHHASNEEELTKTLKNVQRIAEWGLRVIHLA